MRFEYALAMLLAVFFTGYLLGMYGRWQERVRARRGRRLVERLARERAPW